MWRVLAVTALLAVVGCSTSAEPSVTSTPTNSPVSTPAAPTPTRSAPLEVPPELVVVHHATLAQLRLPAAAAARLVAGSLGRWRGFRVVTGPAGQAIRAVERDPGAIAVVPLEAVGPTVTVARMASRDPIRDHPDAVQVTVVGDLMLVRGVPDPAAALAPMADRLRRADLTIGNLENTLSTDGSPTQGGDSFGGTPALLAPLERAGFDALSVANNHAGDYGRRALLATVRALHGSAVAPFGAGADLRRASQPAYVERAGVRFAIIGFNAIGETPRAMPGAAGALSVRMPPRTGPLVRTDLAHVTRVVRTASRRADVVIVLPHWGTQYTHRPEPAQRVVGAALVRAGADLVVGGHPHWVQGVDLVDGVPVLHSLGNFVFDMDFMAETMEGVLLEATFWGPRLKAIRLVPYRMDPATFAPRPIRGAGILADVWSASTGPYAAR